MDAKNRKIKFKFCESMGLEGEEGLSSSDMAKIMDGYVENMAEVWFCLFSHQVDPLLIVDGESLHQGMSRLQRESYRERHYSLCRSLCQCPDILSDG